MPAAALRLHARPTVRYAEKIRRLRRRLAYLRRMRRWSGPKRENLYRLLRLLRGEPPLDTVRFGVGTHYPVE